MRFALGYGASIKIENFENFDSNDGAVPGYREQTRESAGGARACAAWECVIVVFNTV